MMTLLEIAKDYPAKRKPWSSHCTDEEIELAVAFIHGEITSSQYHHALISGGYSHAKTISCVNHYATSALRSAFHRGKIVVRRQEENDG